MAGYGLRVLQYYLTMAENAGASTQHDTQHNDIQHNDTLRNDIRRNNTQHNDTQHNDTQRDDYQHSIQLNDNHTPSITALSDVMLSVIIQSVIYAKCHKIDLYAECH
jgi:hypothetical protein